MERRTIKVASHSALSARDEYTTQTQWRHVGIAPGSVLGGRMVFQGIDADGGATTETIEPDPENAGAMKHTVSTLTNAEAYARLFVVSDDAPGLRGEIDWQRWGLAQIAIARNEALARNKHFPYVDRDCPACWRHRLIADPDVRLVRCEKCNRALDLPELDDQDRPIGIDERD